MKYKRLTSCALRHGVFEHHIFTAKPAVNSCKRLKFVLSVVAFLWVQEDLLRGKKIYVTYMLQQSKDMYAQAQTHSSYEGNLFTGLQGEISEA